MPLFDTLKAVVPLPLKESFHRNKSLPRATAFRLAHRLRGGPPIPPGELIHLVAGHRNPEWFVRGGLSASEAILELAARNGVVIARLGDVLDFGCGVGRILRHFKGVRGPRFHGSDYNPLLTEWCRKNLRFADFETNALEGPLPYGGESFDLVYAFSVFTHLTEPLQSFWMGELRRVLRPGGFVYLTTHGRHYLYKLSEDERERFAAGGLVVQDAAQAGSNICAAYHPESYVRGTLREGFEVLDFRAAGARGDSHHDAWLLRKL